MSHHRTLIPVILLFEVLCWAWLPAASSAQGVAIPRLNLQTATVAAAGNEVHLNQVAFQENGQLKMVDVVITLRPSNGDIVVQGVATEEAAPTLNPAEKFVPGTYVDLAGNKYSLTGGALLAGGRVAWSLKALPGGVTTFDTSWVTGPREGNPVTNYRYDTVQGVSFGIVGISNLTYPDSDRLLFLSGGAIAAAQIGEALTIYSLCDHHGMQKHKPTFQLQFRRVSG